MNADECKFMQMIKHEYRQVNINADRSIRIQIKFRSIKPMQMIPEY